MNKYIISVQELSHGRRVLVAVRSSHRDTLSTIILWDSNSGEQILLEGVAAPLTT